MTEQRAQYIAKEIIKSLRFDIDDPWWKLSIQTIADIILEHVNGEVKKRKTGDQ